MPSTFKTLIFALLVTACTEASEPIYVESQGAVQEPEKESAFVDCMKHKTKEIFPDMPDSALPRLSLQAQITEREYEKLAKTTNKSPTVLADLELTLEQTKSPRNADAIAMKELTRQCSKYINW